MQEIFVDTDSLEELTMVIQDVYWRRRKAFWEHDHEFNDSCSCCQAKKLSPYRLGLNACPPPYWSHVIMRIRFTDNQEDESNPNEKVLYFVDLSEYNEPIDDLQDMFHTLESNITSLSLETRISQFIFEKLRMVDTFRLLSFINIQKIEQMVNYTL